MAFVWIAYLLVIQTENCLTTSNFSDPLLTLSAIRCWNPLHCDTGVGSEWSCRHFYEWKWRRPSSPEDISTDYECCSELLSTHSPEMNLTGFTTPTRARNKKSLFQRKKKTKRNMETFVKIWFPQISLAAPKIWVAQNLEGRGDGGVAAPLPQWHVRLWVLSPVFSIK